MATCEPIAECYGIRAPLSPENSLFMVYRKILGGSSALMGESGGHGLFCVYFFFGRCAMVTRLLVLERFVWAVV
jgi:hypothetical protein